MKFLIRYFLVFFIFISNLYAEFKENDIIASAPAEIREMVRSNINIGVRNQEALRMYDEIIKSDLNLKTKYNILEKLGYVYKAQLGTDIFIGKVMEGLSKKVSGEQIERAVEVTISRLKFSRELVSNLYVDKNIQDKLFFNIYDSLAAGISEGSLSKIMSENRVKNDSEIALEISEILKIMSRARVDATVINDIVYNMLDKNYKAKEIKELRNSFKENLKSYDGKQLAGNILKSMNYGLKLDEIEKNMVNKSGNSSIGNKSSGGSGGGSSGGSGSGGGGKGGGRK